MKLYHNHNLKQLNTFHIDVTADKFYIIESENDIDLMYKTGVFKEPYYFLGGGSNIIFTKNPKESIIHVDYKNIEIIVEDENSVFVSVSAGVVWDDFVAWCVNHDYGGLENLSYIPGSCGASPVQNIGAFGMEICQHLIWVKGFNIEIGIWQQLKNEECKFDYRHSIFKEELKKSFLITTVAYKLTKNNHHFILNYGNITEKLGDSEINLQSIRNAVIEVRKSKLPEPDELGNAGSFFKNPAVPEELANQIKEQFSTIPVFDFKPGFKKVAAGWLIEQCGWKGKRWKNAGVHEKQALVIVNHGNTTAQEILELASQIEESVKNKFNIVLQKEVNII